ncbi:MAG: BrnT family toxin [Nitrospirae bacterium]|nr:BrnT family toxin [Nitrospirota bacterium]
MEFEFDPKKSESNKQKHGLDFHEAKALWDDPDLIEIPVQTIDEPRYLVIATIEGKHWSGVITYRGDKVRIISVRRSRKEEVDIYESESA